MALRVGLVLLALALAASASAQADYNFEWRSFARLSRWDGDKVVTTHGELVGRGSASLASLGSGLIGFDFQGPEGRGNGLVSPAGPRDLTFPTAIAVGEPPAPPHLRGGWFRVAGNPDHPHGFEIHYVEGFICHTLPEGCQNVTVWERSFTGRGSLAARR